MPKINSDHLGGAMATVGFRELKTHTSDIMRRVEAGEAISVTNHGRLVAHIVPPAVSEEEIEQALALLDELDREAQAIDWPAGTSADEIMKEIRPEL
jgi:prevent-host-death family protein